MNARLASATRETFASFEVRNFRLFFLGQGISQVGNWLTLIAQSLLVLDITGSGVAVGLLAACQFGPVLVLGPWAGLVADRSDKRRLLLIVQVVAMAQSFALGALAFMDDPPLAALFAVASIGGLCMAFDNPARRSFVVEMVPEDLVHNAVSLNSAMMTSSRVIGPALGGLLITTVGYGWAFIVDGAVVRRRAHRALADAHRGACARHRSPSGARARSGTGLRYVRDTPVLAIPLVMMTVVGTLAFNFQVTLPLIVTRTFDQSKATFTILFSFISLGSLVGALWTARRRSIGVNDVSGPRSASASPCSPSPWPRTSGGPSRSGSSSASPASASSPRRRPSSRPRPRRRCGAGCWPCRRWSSSAAPPSAGRSWATSPSTPGPRWAVGLGGLAGIGAAACGQAGGPGPRP